MSFEAFDTKKQEEYAARAKAGCGGEGTAAFAAAAIEAYCK